jgi:YD repeat-containing protein
MKTDYQYYPDGSVKFADRSVFNGFDRAFAYDQVSMLREAYSGGQASDYVNGTTGGGSGPYRLSYQHDAFGNLTSRTGSYWSNPDSYNATYVNNRKQDSLWQFDADGRLKQDETLQYKYDAAGQNRSIFNPSDNITTTSIADGDGRQIKRIDASPGSSVNTYYLRSSVLDGRVIAELNPTGQKSKGYVFDGEDLIAVQEFNSITWMHKDPITGSTAQSLQNGTFTSTAELDPSGVNVGAANPMINPPQSAPEWLPMLVADEASCGSNPNCIRCYFHGANIGCTMASHLARSDFATVDPAETSPSALKSLASQPIYGSFCVGTPTAITGTPAGTPGGGSVGTAAGGGVGLTSPGERPCTTENVGYTEGNLATAMSLIPLKEQSPPWTEDKPFQLSKCLQWLLAPYFKAQGDFRGLDLSEIKLYEGLPKKITQFAVIDVAAITIWKSIYFAPNQYASDLDGIELVAHELTHVKQWILNGQIGFPSKYGYEFANNRRKGMSKEDAEKNISFELDAAREAANIKEAIRKQYGDYPCSKDRQ